VTAAGGEFGQRVLITGGASGIGHAMATAFDAAGARVRITDVDTTALDACPAAWSRSSADVSDEAAISSLFADLEKDWAGLDVLCANAGTAGPTAAIEDIALADWQRCVSINLEGTFLPAKYAAPMMKRQKAGVMLITSSTAGLFGYPNRAAYAAAKWAVIGLMKTLAMELGPFGIRVNAVCPGAVEGERMDAVIARESAVTGKNEQEIREGYASGTSMRNWVTGNDIAEMAVFLASPQARFVSGQVIAVDGHTFNPDPSA